MSILKAIRIGFPFNLWIFKNSLVFQIAPVCGLCMLHFPAQVFYLCFQLCLLIFKLKLIIYQIKHLKERAKGVRTYQFLPGTGLYVVGVGICVLKRVSEEVSYDYDFNQVKYDLLDYLRLERQVL